MKNSYIYIIILFLSLSTKAQIITIPDANFKDKLLQANTTNSIASSTSYQLTPMLIDANGNGEIEVSEALLVRQLFVDNSNISSMTGIESFTNLIKLKCNNNLLGSLDINSLSLLQSLDCSHNLLSSLSCQNISNTIDYFDCSYNNLISLVLPNFFEFLDMGFQIIYANCSHNQLSTIVFSPNEELSHLDLSYNNFTSLSFTRLSIYGSLGLSNIPLNTLDLHNVYLGPQDPDDIPTLGIENTNLTELYIPFSISSGSSISNNPNLVHLNIKNGLSNFEFYYELDEFGEETGNIIYDGMQVNNNPQLALICCDENEITYYSGIVPSTVQVSEYCNFTPGGNYNVISGSVVYNCPGGQPFNSNVSVLINNVYEASFVDGVSYIAFTSYGNQNVYLGLSNPGYFTVTPPNYAFNFLTAGGNNETADFCISPNGVHPDLDATILPISSAKPGFDATYKLIVKNKGTETQSGTIALNFDEPILDFVSATPTISAQSSGLLSWNFSGLAPFEDEEITFTVNVNSPLESPAVNIGDVLHYSVSVSTPQTDETPTDNQMEFNQTVIGSLDPNDKIVLEGPQVSISKIDDYLHYMVRFQNTGTAAAENVVVKDILDFKLDQGTLQMVSGSHPYKSSLTNGNKLEVVFENINLPPSSLDELDSHGYFAFKIKAKPTLVVDDMVENKAYIYFDYNYPIETNTVETTFGTLGISFHKNGLFAIYPNPTSSVVNIVVSNNQPIIKSTINNVLGQTIMTFGNSTTFDISSLTKGVYFVTVETESGKGTQRIIKQ